MPNCAGCQKAAACDVCVAGYRLNADNSTCISESFLFTNDPGQFSKHIASMKTYVNIVIRKHAFVHKYNVVRRMYRRQLQDEYFYYYAEFQER